MKHVELFEARTAVTWLKSHKCPTCEGRGTIYPDKITTLYAILNMDDMDTIKKYLSEPSFLKQVKESFLSNGVHNLKEANVLELTKPKKEDIKIIIKKSKNAFSYMKSNLESNDWLMYYQSELEETEKNVREEDATLRKLEEILEKSK